MSDPFTQLVLSFLESLNDPKPGRVSRGILPIVQSANLWQNPTPINFNVSGVLFKVRKILFHLSTDQNVHSENCRAG